MAAIDGLTKQFGGSQRRYLKKSHSLGSNNYNSPLIIKTSAAALMIYISIMSKLTGE